jgi:hypothetical protein
MSLDYRGKTNVPVEIYQQHLYDLNVAIDVLGPLVARAAANLRPEHYTLIAELRHALDAVTEIQNREYQEANYQVNLDCSTCKNCLHVNHTQPEGKMRTGVNTSEPRP